MIEFTEKEHWTHDDPFIGRTYAPVYMVKNGQEFFVVNRVVHDGEPGYGKYHEKKSCDEVERIKVVLLSNDGRYFKFNGFYDDPMEMLAEIEEWKHTFVDPGDIFWICHKADGTEAGFIDFHGNRREVSDAFHYRIYDDVLVSQIKKTVEPIVERSEKK